MAVLVTVTLASILYLVVLCVYRIWLHPLASIPGPRLAALTGWYEAYFELFHKGLGGQYTFHIKELHKKYGPIVRISPWEVHIDDPDFYPTIYTSREGLDRPEYLTWRFGSPYALLSTADHHLHKMRRAAQDPFFAKNKITKLGPMIQEKAIKMCDVLASDFAQKGRPVTLDDMFACFIADVTTQYSFDRDFDWLGHEDFQSPFLKAISNLKGIAHPCTQFPWLARLATALPPSVVGYLQPSMRAVHEFQEEMRQLVRGAQRDIELGVMQDAKGSGRGQTIIHGILRSGLPKEELQVERLKDHAAGLLAAGVASPAWTLRTAMFHIISNKTIYERLQEELDAAIPDPKITPPLNQLEQLPYLRACIEEAIRLCCGQIARSPRVSKKPVRYGNYVLAPGTHISLDTWHMHHNTTLYPDSFAYKPERWLGSARAPAPYDARPLKHYMTAFGRGTRICLGITLTYAELPIALALLLRKFDWELFETTYERDIKVVRDQMAPDVSPESKGVRALAKQRV